jgi:hypothetical protein
MKDKYKTLILSCWVVLLCCFVVKLLGGNFFEIVCENEKFIMFCEYCNTGIMYWVIAYITYAFSTTIYLMAVCKFEKPKWYIILGVLIICTIKAIVNMYPIIATIIELCFLILTPIVINKNNWKRSIVGYLLVMVFQVVSLLTKNVGIQFIRNDIFITLIFSIDYYIMLILYWLYSIKEESYEFWNFIFRFRRQRKHQ